MIPRMRGHTAIPLVSLLIASQLSVRVGRAQSAIPAAVVDSFFKATEQERWSDAARLMDLVTFGALQDEEVRNMRRAKVRRRPITPEMLMKSDPKMPRDVAEYQAARTNEAMDQSDWLVRDYANVGNVDTLAALSPKEAAARWLEAKDERYQMRQSLAQARAHCNLPDSLITRLASLPATTHRVLGTVMDDSLAYVLYAELPSGGEKPDSASRRSGRRARMSRAFWVMPPPVMTLRRIAGQWRIAPAMPFGAMSGYASFDCEPKGSRKSSSRSP